jgi:K+-transporting ATPase ATPase A chain
MMLGEVIIGGAGSGLYGMLLFVIISMFVAGLMVGRTPEYVGKKLEAKEVKMTILAILCVPLSILGFTAITSSLDVNISGFTSTQNIGPHRFTEILYAFTSSTANNGSAFAGLSSDTLFYNLALAFAMLIGRFFFIVPTLAVAGSLAAKQSLPPSLGTFPTTGPLFVSLLVGVILIIGGLTFFPVLSLGPIAEHLAMLASSTL